MKLATIVLGIAAAAVAAPIQSSDTPVSSGLDRRGPQGGGPIDGWLGAKPGILGSAIEGSGLPLLDDLTKKLPVGGSLGGGGKVRREESLKSTTNKQIERREASPLGTEVLSAVVPVVAGLAGGIGGGGGGAKVRRDESIEATVAADVEPTGEDAANVQKRQLPIKGDVVNKLMKIVSETGLKRDEGIVSKEDGTI
ncbi:hypothetical protein ASPVEDRAFT_45689 [Aspergillus versicolor CBS 583.65]|uniref:Uncharacterized protein n=1 Tax=Aspergillus versicolor CBS 583.65 TaxID=1036611 RepID=A0A1L9PXP1_ASPVE|nr:uncharacterized protein ASPVEDRAFT_45689 [Aspergillus versicolor CBS 583.65]OJJ06287.1 hypothetical protein ASPVEDRAFT_45689 [Aspergillus versicolor CBS 583.65]